MPTDMVSFVVSTGLGVSVLAGIISGVCYVLAHGSPKKSNRKAKSNLHCDVCGEYFRSIDHIIGGDSSVTCLKCQKKVCQKRCASPNQQQNSWTCKNCLRPPESWFQGFLYAIQPKEESTTEKMSSNEEIEKTKVQVQDFIEKLINSIIGQNVDDANVTKLYNDKNYDKFFEKYHPHLSKALTELGTSLHSSIIHLPLIGQESPCTAHAALKQLIEKILQEVISLPQLQQLQQGNPIPSDFDNKTYEDLLATAILNKVISNSQNARPSSSAASVSSRISNASNVKEEKEFFFGEETLDNKWRHPDLETTSISSLEDWIQSDSSFGSKKYVDRVTLTIKQDIEEVSQASESDNEDDERDDSEYFGVQSSIWGDEEPNWFLQKRAFKGAHSPVPVPMLVPNPTTEAKVLIGDQEVDETSDLSDVGSDYGDAEIVPTRHNLITSKTVIGGKNPHQNGTKGGESESESSADSGVKEVDRGHSMYDETEFTDRAERDSQTGFEQQPVFVTRADITVDDDNVEDASIISVYSNTEQEAEYTERYASLPRTIEKKPDPSSSSVHKPGQTNIDSKTSETSEDKEDEDVKIVQMHFSGNYSKREKEKWKNAVEMKNNPYSKENIEKRIQRSNSGVGSLFGSDYYAKLASSPSGIKTRSLEVNGHAWPPASTDNKDDVNNNEPDLIAEKYISKTYITREDQDIFKAIPVVIEPEGEYLTFETNPAASLSPQMASLTSDSDLSYVHVYNIENAAIIKTSKQEEGKEETGAAKEQHGENIAKPEKKKFSKSVNTNSKRFVNSQSLKRHKSETDLLDDSFYTLPKPLGKKKDNTLISKIYLDPQVRSFALSNRQQLPVNHVIPTFRKQFSIPETALENKAYYSDDGFIVTNKKSTVYSSEEDLLSSKSGNIKNETMVQTAKMYFSSEDEQYSEKSSSYGTDQRIKSQIYSSSEDLLSIDEMDPPKKRDNTLISKIYQQPTVRKYALANRYAIPVQDTRKLEKSASSEDEVFSDISRVPKAGSPKNISEVETQLETMVVRERKSSKFETEDENDPGVEAIAKKKIVHTLLGKFSASQPILGKWESKEDDINSDGDINISVKNLRRKFEKNQGKNNIVSSLTARSLSKQMKQELRN